MKSATAITYELDDIPAAAEELLQQITEKIVLKKESVAILHGQPEMELGELSALLYERLGFPVIGGTTAGAAMLSNDGHHELAVMLHVMTADDCLFSVSISSSMAEQPKQCIVDTYHQALDRLRQKDAAAQPKMAFCVTSIVQSCSSDDCLSILSEVSGALSIFGFVAADDFQFCKQQVFLNGVRGNDVIAILLISGNVRPIFEVKNLAGSQSLSRRKITKAHGNIICEIDDKPAYEYLKDFQFIDDDAANILWNYQFFVETPDKEDNDGVAVSRALNTYDKVSGEISCFADVPQGSYIQLQYCKDSDVRDSCEKALAELKTKIDKAADDYQYSTVLIVSCSLRNMFLADQKNAEGVLVHKIMPDSLCISGLYGFGEIAPTSVNDGKAVNRFHNATMTICAL